MPTIRVDTEINDTQVQALLNRLAQIGADLEEPLLEIGEYLLQSHDFRFQLAIAPDGTPWEPLANETVRRKQRKSKKPDILVQDEFLRLCTEQQISHRGNTCTSRER